MPRPSLPKLFPRPKPANSFRLDASAKRDIAQTLGLKSLPKHTAGAIERAVNCYNATKSGSASTTVANTLLVLRKLEQCGLDREEALALLENDRAGVDYTTHNVLQPLLRAVRDQRIGANDALVQVARKRAAELAVHPRVTTSTEPMRLFCGVLRTIFNGSSNRIRGQITKEEAWRRCRRFALAIFTAASIGHADFDAHPERLTEYLGTDVSDD